MSKQWAFGNRNYVEQSVPACLLRTAIQLEGHTLPYILPGSYINIHPTSPTNHFQLIDSTRSKCPENLIQKPDPEAHGSDNSK